MTWLIGLMVALGMGFAFVAGWSYGIMWERGRSERERLKLAQTKGEP